MHVSFYSLTLYVMINEFGDIWNTSQGDYYILFNKRVLSDFSYFSGIWRRNFDNFILGHTVYVVRYIIRYVSTELENNGKFGKNPLCGPVETFGKRNLTNRLSSRFGFSEPPLEVVLIRYFSVSRFCLRCGNTRCPINRYKNKNKIFPNKNAKLMRAVCSKQLIEILSCCYVQSVQ